MAANPKTKPDTKAKASSSQSGRPRLKRGFPGTNEERAEQRRRFAEEHRETLRRLGK